MFPLPIINCYSAAVILPPFDWGAVLKKLGASVATIPLGELTGDRLASSIRSLIEDDSFQTNARQLQAQIQAEEGALERLRLLSLIFAKGQLYVCLYCWQR